jgi:ATP-dependent RNA helicase RhlE
MRSLCDAGFAAQRLHSNRSQQQRREALEGFRRGRYRILVATDIAARGIDVADIRHVINYDLPMTVEDYVHRVGRTARAEAHGRATSFASPEERGQLRAIERHIGRSLPRESATPTAVRGPAPHRSPASAPQHHAGPAQHRAPAPHRNPRPVDATAPASSRPVRQPLSLADVGIATEPQRHRPSAQARRARRGRHS